MGLSLPTQELLRTLFDTGGAHPLHGSAVFHEHLERLASGERLRCARCNWSADRRDLTVFAAAQAKRAGGDTPAQAAWSGIFTLNHRNHDHDDFSTENLELVCEPCHHAHHLFVPGIELGGDLALLNTVAQPEIIALWRVLSVAARSENASGRLSFNWLNTLRTKGTGVAMLAFGYTPGRDSQIGHRELVYWLAHAPEEIYARAASIAADIRFFPRAESFETLLAFCEAHQPSLDPGPQKTEADSLSLA